MSKPKKPKLENINLGDDFSLNLDHYLSGDYHDISVAAEELPPVVEWVNSKLQELIEQKLIKQHAIKIAEGKAYFDLKSGGYERAGYAGKPTNEALAHAVALNENVIKAIEDYAVLYGWVERLRSLQGSLQTKLDLIRSSEATRRRVWDSEGTNNRDRD